MSFLFVIPARDGSKGIPGKNIKPLLGKPLIHYSIEYARLFTEDRNICLSTDNLEIAACAAEIGLHTPFLRPAELATDTSGSVEVLLHALDYYDSKGFSTDAVILLQPTSPFRERKHFEDALKLYNDQVDMVVSVKNSKANPYYNLFEEDALGNLHISKPHRNFTRRQDIPPVYEFNGSIYIINASSLRSNKSFKEFSTVKKYIMEDRYSVDLDTPSDWEYLSFLFRDRNGK